jgi:hypothetical protein
LPAGAYESRNRNPMRPGLGAALLAVLVVALSSWVATASHETRSHPLATLLWTDMHRAHEVLPQGVPSDFNWARRPRVNMGNNPRGFRALLGWGQLYPCAGDRSGPLAPVELRDLNTWVLSRSTSRWKLVEASQQVVGGAYREDYLNNESVPGDVGTGPGGGTLVTMLPERNFHFWEATGRTEIDPTNIMGVVVTLRARLLSNQPVGAVSHECLVLGVGADYWFSKTAIWTSHGRTVRDVGIGRFKLVEPTWRLYTMTSASSSLLRRYPLPYSVPSSELY